MIRKPIMTWQCGFVGCILLLFSHASMAQVPTQPTTYTVRGQVLSLLDGLPIADIEVYLKGTTLHATSDSNGVFVIRGVPPGAYDVVAKYPDFDATILQNVQVPPRAQQTFVFNLEPKTTQKPLPFLDVAPGDSLGVLEGSVEVKIDTFKSHYQDGFLVLRATVAGNLTTSYVYPQKWRLLAVHEQDFRFKFFLPRDKVYRLYLVWQEASSTSIAERIVEVARKSDTPQEAALFDLQTQQIHSQIRIMFDTEKLP